MTRANKTIRGLAAIHLLFAGNAFAAEPGIGADAAFGASQFSSLGAGMVMVVLAILLLGFLYAKMQGMRSGSNGVINIVATQAIGPKERIAIVEVSDKQLLIGMTTTSIQTLHVFDERVAETPAPRISFADRLKSALRSAQQ